MAFSSLSVEAVSLVEDAFLRGEWTQALIDSRSILATRIVPLQEARDFVVMTTEEERVLSVYLQTIFELNLDDEVETAATIAKVFSPLPSGIAIQYCNFLMAMNRRLVAKKALQDLLDSFTVNGEVDFSTEQYVKAAETMALQLILPDEGIKAAQQFVAGDKVLDDEVKLQMFHRIQTMHLAAQEANKDNSQTSPRNQTVKSASGTRQETDATYQSVSTAFTGTQQPATKQNDDSSSYVVIGVTAIALAVAAAGALRYREKIYESMSSAIPALSKVVADAKFALFEA